MPDEEEEALSSTGMRLDKFIVPDDHATASTGTLTSCTHPAGINAHERDSHLRFEADGHNYFWNGASVGCSVPRMHILTTKLLINLTS